MLKKETLIIGAGAMAIEYAKILHTLKISFHTIGRGEASAQKYAEETGFPILTGGIDANSEIVEKYTHAIVAVNVDTLAETTISLIKNGIKNILVEKPGGLNIKEIEKVNGFAKENEANVFIAYNRRFYSSVIEARKKIEEDGGVLSFQFDFTEWSHVISNLSSPSTVKENWFLANSTHVVDLAFYLGGEPKNINSFVKGGLDWHPRASIFSGSGETHNGALFSYHSNWEAPGRWGIELFTKNHRLVLRPLEKLQIQKHGTVAVEMVEVEDALDQKFKPGLYKQVEAFYKEPSTLLGIGSHLEKVKQVYSKIGNL